MKIQDNFGGFELHKTVDGKYLLDGKVFKSVEEAFKYTETKEVKTTEKPKPEPKELDKKA